MPLVHDASDRLSLTSVNAHLLMDCPSSTSFNAWWSVSSVYCLYFLFPEGSDGVTGGHPFCCELFLDFLASLGPPLVSEEGEVEERLLRGVGVVAVMVSEGWTNGGRSEASMGDVVCVVWLAMADINPG